MKLQLLNLITYITLVVVNILALQIPFFGKTPGDVSDSYYNLLTPVDVTFRIWSVIYILLGFFVIKQWQSMKEDTTPREVSSLGYLFLLTTILNIGWLLSWQSEHIALAFLFIFGLWISLIIINYRLTMLRKASWHYRVPFSFYLAWVCIAALANLNVLFMDLGFNFFGLTEEVWTTGLIILGIFGTLLVLYLNQDLWFTGVLIWSYLGIYLKNQALTPQPSLVVYSSMFAMIFLFAVGLIVGLRKRRVHPM